jgi:hypothetical protein
MCGVNIEYFIGSLLISKAWVLGYTGKGFSSSNVYFVSFTHFCKGVTLAYANAKPMMTHEEFKDRFDSTVCVF